MAQRLNYRAHALVLRRTKLGEADLILTLLTDGSHQVRAVAKGARKPRAKLAGVVGLGNEVDLLLRTSRSLDIVTEGELLCSRDGIGRDFERATMMEVILDVACELTTEGEHDVRLLPLASTALDCVASCRPALLGLVGAAFVLKAVSMQGYRPEFSSCISCGRDIDLRGEGSTLFSFADGGCICAECAGIERGRGVPSATLAWASALIGMRFSEVCALPEHAGDAELGVALLRFAREWLSHYPGCRSRALEFAISMGEAGAGPVTGG